MIPIVFVLVAVIGLALWYVTRPRTRTLGTYEPVTDTAGFPCGAVSYSARLKRWGCTWNMCPYDDDTEIYQFATREAAIAELARKYPTAHEYLRRQP